MARRWLEADVILLGLILICVLSVHLADRSLSFLVPNGKALPLIFEPDDLELWVEGGGNSVEADVRLKEESVEVVIKFGVAKGYCSSKVFQLVCAVVRVVVVRPQSLQIR